MISLSEQIYGILKTVSDAKQVSFFYPQSWTELPAVTFYEQQNQEYARVDNGHEYLTEVAYQIDVWAKTPEDCLKIATQVNDRLREIGLKREFSADLYDNGIHHKTMRFGGLVQPDTERIYQ